MIKEKIKLVFQVLLNVVIGYLVGVSGGVILSLLLPELIGTILSVFWGFVAMAMCLVMLNTDKKMREILGLSTDGCIGRQEIFETAQEIFSSE